MIGQLLGRLYTRHAFDGTPYNIRCLHRSHWLRLPCLRLRTWDHRCPKHLRSCWSDDDCRSERRARRLATIEAGR